MGIWRGVEMLFIVGCIIPPMVTMGIYGRGISIWLAIIIGF